eukprot:Blabericola_migrator_1__840@NODE_1206_length_5110_cov_47_888757_g818_i0_p2_GENE_NODE_1206_length_5110_cov_47_888757_g818_i0NODE_1206_length_5110_cov_47_888757_g818_i0_p2_ORF_typecomplete_len289_score24_83GyrIlike/PF06445_15/0_0011GyrIlike/PF06445_15/2_6e03_NODE_1206_length_5110_cov_47_888757_g818_i031924058
MKAVLPLLCYSVGALPDGLWHRPLGSLSRISRHHHHLDRSAPEIPQSRYSVQDRYGVSHSFAFVNFHKPLTIGMGLSASGDPERALLLLPRMEALARSQHMLPDPAGRSRLFGLRWESDDGMKFAFGAGVEITPDARAPNREDMIFYHAREGPHLVIHRSGPHRDLESLYSLVYHHLFPRFGLSNRTDSDFDDDDDETVPEKIKGSWGWDEEEEVEETSSSTELSSSSTEEDDDFGMRVRPPYSAPVVEEYGGVPSTAVAWSDDLVTVCYIPIADIPPGLEVSHVHGE